MSKYHAVRTGGYASKKESRRAQELAILYRAGAIQNLEQQIRYEIIPTQDSERAAHYIADFTYWENGKFVVEDCKGFRTPEYILKRKLMLLVHKHKIRET